MTTSVTIAANHGWPVRITMQDSKTGEATRVAVVESGNTETFIVFDTQDILVHEIQPDEIKETEK